MPSPAAALAQRLQGLNLFLVGMMGSGKSSVGRPLASALGYRFVDADQLLEQAAGRSIAAIFASEGEDGFRQLETQVLDAISPWQRTVVATGGGVVLRPMNWGYLRQGVVIWLDAPETVLLQRLRQDPTARPLLDQPDPRQRLQELLNQRRPLYAQADLQVQQGDETAEAVAAKVLEVLPSVLRQAQPAAPSAAVAIVDRDGHRRESIN
ncbi:MAG: shikimate kinase [Cyanobium sp.]|jgi:shikimate kinase|nr:shikimate kinase [Synechococcaceae cyanobacterium]